MSFSGLILTNRGKMQLSRAMHDNPLEFTHIAIGDGSYSGSFSSKTALENEVLRLPVQYVSRQEDIVVIQCDWTSQDAPRAFYFRELGVIGNGELCYYDNAGQDAEWIDPGNQNVSKQKRTRISLAIDGDVQVELTISSGLYALAVDLIQFQEEIENTLDELKNYVSEGKSGIASALTSKGVSTAADAAFEVLALNVALVYDKGVSNTKKGNAVAGDVLAGKTFTSEAAGVNQSGGIQTLSVDEVISPTVGREIHFHKVESASHIGSPFSDHEPYISMTIPANKYTGAEQYDTAILIKADKFGEALAAQVLKDVTFSSKNGLKISGTMESVSVDGDVAPGGYHVGYFTFSGDVTDYTDYILFSIDARRYTGNVGYVAAEKSNFGDAAAAQVLSGKTFSSSAGLKKTGTMTNQGKKTATLTASNTSYTIPAGYHDGTGSVSISTQTKTATPTTSDQTISPDSGKFLSGVTVKGVSVSAPAAGNILTGSSVSVTSNGTTLKSVSGTMANKGAVTGSVGVGGSYTIPAGYHNGSGKITGPTLSGNAGASNVLSGKTFYNNSGTKQTGTMKTISHVFGIGPYMTFPKNADYAVDSSPTRMKYYQRGTTTGITKVYDNSTNGAGSCNFTSDGYVYINNAATPSMSTKSLTSAKVTQSFYMEAGTYIISLCGYAYDRSGSSGQAAVIIDVYPSSGNSISAGTLTMPGDAGSLTTQTFTISKAGSYCVGAAYYGSFYGGNLNIMGLDIWKVA